MLKHVLVLCISFGISLVIFLLGFFPNISQNVLSKNRSQSAGNNASGLQTDNQKFVLLIVDSLWSQFIFSAITDGRSQREMPYLRSQYVEKNICVYEAIADSPTVTLPRIKAILSGTVPSFLDILKNLRNDRLYEDNLVTISQSSEKKIVFYGDDTWLKMFPEVFHRSEGTTSFFASDYSEVDQNVTRHLERELSQEDWDVMILHYLGLDHIGHIYGPSSHLVDVKLKEMDEVLRQIDIALKEKGSNYTILLMGDHGMSTTGSHGGGSKEERSIPLVFVKSGCVQAKPDASPYLQIDVTPTIATLLGVRTPDQNLGVVIQDIVHSDAILPPDKQLQATIANLYQLEDLAENSGELDDDVRQKVDELRQALKNSLMSTDFITTKKHVAEAHYLAMNIRDKLLSRSGDYDVYSMAFATFILSLVLLCSFTLVFAVPKTHQSFAVIVIAALSSASAHLILCTTAFSSSAVCFSRPWSPVLALTTLTLMTTSAVRIILSHKLSFEALNFGQLFVFVGSAYHGLSFFSSSFIEEEHQTWYYIVPSLLLLISLHNLEVGWSKTEGSSGAMKVMKNRAVLSALLCVSVHRVAKHWNQTGDKWAKEPDFEDWLIREENLMYLNCLFVLSLIGLFVLICTKEKSITQKVIVGLGFVFVGVFRLKYGTTTPHDYGSVLLPRITYSLSALLLLLAVFTRDKNILTPLILLFALLRRVHNVPLLFLTVIQGFLARQPLKILLRYQNGKFFTFVAYYWLGMSWFFYQGNSNSFANIDVAAGYVGLTSYEPLLIGVLLFLSTFQGPLLALAFYQDSCEDITGRSGTRKGERWSLLLHLCLVRSFPVFLYMVTVIVLRHHLFIWSVFAPKLMYESALTVFLFACGGISILVRNYIPVLL